MARLLIEAASNSRHASTGGASIHLVVSVSDAATGQSITGLKDTDFRVTAGISTILTGVGANKAGLIFKITERLSLPFPDPAEPTGVYDMDIAPLDLGKQQALLFQPGQNVGIGLLVRRFKGKTAVDFGQTVVSYQVLENTALPK